MTEPNNAVAGDETKKRDEYVRGGMKATYIGALLSARYTTIAMLRQLRQVGINSALDASESPLPDALPTEQRMIVTQWCCDLEKQFAEEYERNAGARRRSTTQMRNEAPPR